MSRPQHLKSLNGIKGLAISFIILYHLFPHLTKGGFVWVNTFLVLAGFFTARKLQSMTNTVNFTSLAHYLFKTLKRLVIPLFFILTCLVTFLILFDRQELSYDRGDIFSGLFLYNNFFQIWTGKSYFVQMAGSSPFTHLWYVALYVQSFLLLLPLVLGIERLNLSTGHKACAWLGILSLSHLATGFVYQPNGDPSATYYGLITRFSSVAAGVALTYLMELSRDWLKQTLYRDLIVNTTFLISLLGLLFMSFTVWDQAPSTYTIWLPYSSLLSMGLIFAVSERSPLSQWLGILPLNHLGQRSYSYYLWYYPLIAYVHKLFSVSWLSNLVLLVLIPLIAEASYYLIEQKPLLSRQSVARVLAIRPLYRNPASYFGASVVLLWLIALLLSGNNKRLAMLELEYLQFNNQPNISQLAFPGSEGVKITLQQLTTLDKNVSTNFAGKRYLNAPLNLAALLANEQNNSELNTLIQQNQAILTDFQERNPELSTKLSAPEILFATEYPVTLFGDSVALVNSQLFEQSFAKGNAYGKVSLSVYNGALDVFQSMLDAGEIKANVVIQLGINGGLDQDSLEKLVALAGDRQLYFMTVQGADIEDNLVNGDLRQLATKHANVTLLDWETYQKGHPDWYISDGVHMNGIGSVEYVRFIIQQLYQLNQIAS